MPAPPKKVLRIDYSKAFLKQLKKAPLVVQKSFRVRLEMFLSNPFDPLLNNHKLTGKYRNYRSVNVTGDWRAIFREIDDGKIVYFDLLGTHSQLYK